MGKLSDRYGITGPKAGKGSAPKKSKAVAERRTAAAERAVRPPEVPARIEVARAAVSGMAPLGVKFLMKITDEMAERLEVERRRRGLRSRVATIVAVLDGGMK